MAAAPDHDPDGSPGVAVIIPFYQRKPGLLPRALASVFAQRDVPPPTVIVVDDASPVPAADEVAALPAEQRRRVQVIRQANAGPGAARNHGLDHLPEAAAYAAFLDSDDQWLDGHLARALAALESGRDFYFSNYRDIGREEGGFERRGTLQPAEHAPVPGQPDVYDYRGDLCGAVLTACPIETSTVVFRPRAFPDLRFRADFRHAYEDLMFWFEMAARGRPVAFSTAVGTQYGTGINMYRGVQAGTDAALRVIVGSTRFGAGVRAAFPLSDGQRAAVARRLQRNRRAVATELMHRLRRRLPVPRSDLAAFLRADPRAWVLLPWEFVRQSLAWLLHRGEAAAEDRHA